ncbi:MAG: hypothetical protein KGI04_02430 [Candidatus Micrarchaeota archaeon]|nr:hypothetical protein [Candidatus Micrarchaeota archaeon]
MKRKTKGKADASVIIAVLAILVAVAAYGIYSHGIAVPVYASTSSTPPAQSGLLSQSFTNTSLLSSPMQFGLPSTFYVRSGPNTTYVSPCGQISLEVYHQYQLPATLNATNYSKLNESTPIFFYDLEFTFNKVFDSTTPPESCTYIEDVGNYAQRSSTTDVSGQIGTRASLIELDNFSAAGLNATHVPYTGPTPHLSWYEVEFTYRNVLVVCGEWSFTGQMNPAVLVNCSRRIYANLLAAP